MQIHSDKFPEEGEPIDVPVKCDNCGKVQMIQRTKASRKEYGKWVDTVHSMSGMVSPIDGGRCWEQSDA